MMSQPYWGGSSMIKMKIAITTPTYLCWDVFITTAYEAEEAGAVGTRSAAAEETEQSDGATDEHENRR